MIVPAEIGPGLLGIPPHPLLVAIEVVMAPVPVTAMAVVPVAAKMGAIKGAAVTVMMVPMIAAVVMVVVMAMMAVISAAMMAMTYRVDHFTAGRDGWPE